MTTTDNCSSNPVRWLAILSGQVRASLAVSGGVHTGLDAIKAVLVRHAAAPLVEIADTLRRGALAHGSQLDDQTVLLLRHRPRGAS